MPKDVSGLPLFHVWIFYLKVGNFMTKLDLAVQLTVFKTRQKLLKLRHLLTKYDTFVNIFEFYWSELVW